MDKKKIITILLVLAVVLSLTFIYFQQNKTSINKKPIVEITYPYDGSVVSKIVTISGTATDPDGDENVQRVEVTMNNQWDIAEGNNLWSYEWKVFEIEDGFYTVKVRSWDGTDYSEIKEIYIEVDNPEIVANDAHKWAIFIAASNFPEDNESKLGNGALNLAEDISIYFIENLGYSTSNIILLFDDGWIREDNGYGEPNMTLDQRRHEYDITYGGATKETLISTLNYVVEESNKFDDSEVFIWIASHGCGDSNRRLFGGRLLKQSAIFLWDDIFSDKELSDLLSGLNSKKTCIIVDACYSGGFADKTILNLPEFFLFRSDLSKSGRVVMTGASKFRLGYASTTQGPLFSQLWFYGIASGEADGFRPGILKIGRQTLLKIFKDEKVSVEEAFYYARYILRNSENLEDYSNMEPQINDQYPRRGLFGSLKGLILGE
ncbi:MAG: caspase family protein [Thermoplasmatales archaeon]|nr:MAG: caspase family protein [Thermoplasmatales archaeon]